MLEKYLLVKKPDKGKKFHCPRKLKENTNNQVLIDWYEDKLERMVLRQFRLGDLISRLYRAIKSLKRG